MATSTVPTLDHTPQDVAGQTVVVTGGSSGIGRATALMLADRGAQVLTCARSAETLAEARRDFEEAEGPVHTVVADLSELQGVQALFEAADQQLGDLDVLVCNAALPAETVADADYETIDTVVRTNLTGYLACCHEALRRMAPRQRGHIVLIGSMSADVREKGSSLYVATKSGVQGFAEALRKEANEVGVKVTLVEPGAVGTDMQDEPETHEQKAERLEMLKAEDIAACVLYALTQPRRCDVVEVRIRPHRQSI